MSAYELNKTILKDSANLKAYYRFESDVTDSSSNGNNGSATAVTYTTGKYGNAGVFDGSTSFVSVTDSASTSFTTAVSVSAWINVDVTTSVRTIIAKPRSAGGYGFSFDVNTGKISLVLNNGTTGYQLDGTTTISTGIWYHVACTWDGTTGRVYLNGKHENSSTTSFSSISDSAEAVNIGRQNAGLAQYFDGMIDDLAVFSTALSADQIKELYEGRYIGEWRPQSNLVGLWHLNGNSTDASGNNNHGTDTAITYSLANGKIAQGAGFASGSSSKIILPNNASLRINSSFTVMGWMKIDSIPTSNANMLTNYEEAGFASGWIACARSSDNKFHFEIFDNVSASNTVASTITVVDSVWRHYALVADGTKIRMYINGAENNNATQTFTPICAATIYPRIGVEARDGTDRYFFNGAIDEVAIFSRALTAAEIRHWYAWSVGKYI